MTGTVITLRIPKEAHINAITDMMADFYAIDDYPFETSVMQEQVRYFLANEHLGRLWILQHADLVLGYVVLSFGFSFEYKGRDTFIDELFIKSDERGKGIGKKALILVEEEAKKLSVNALHLEVESHNEAGKKLYYQQGFRGNNRKLLSKILHS